MAAIAVSFATAFENTEVVKIASKTKHRCLKYMLEVSQGVGVVVFGEKTKHQSCPEIVVCSQ